MKAKNDMSVSKQEAEVIARRHRKQEAEPIEAFDATVYDGRFSDHYGYYLVRGQTLAGNWLVVFSKKMPVVLHGDFPFVAVDKETGRVAFESRVTTGV